MVYVYKCPNCETVVEINKPIAESSRVEHCEKCNSVLNRCYNISGIKTGDGIK